MNTLYLCLYCKRYSIHIANGRPNMSKMQTHNCTHENKNVKWFLIVPKCIASCRYILWSDVYNIDVAFGSNILLILFIVTLFVGFNMLLHSILINAKKARKYVLTLCIFKFISIYFFNKPSVYFINKVWIWWYDFTITREGN